jgi:hypothetical protein
MTPEKQAILDAATPRPWDVCDDEPLEGVVDKSYYIAKTQTAANSSLIVIAVNAYEAQSALIERLVKTLHDARNLLVMEGYSSDAHIIIPEIDAVLDEAKKVQP